MVDHVHALPKGYYLQEYRITETLGFGGFGITYSAIDTNLDKVIAIKEYLPSDLAVRIDGSTVSAKSEKDKDGFAWGLDRFLDEAKTVARFDHPNIVRIHRFFELNGTGYIVMEFIKGRTLSSVLREKRTLEESEIRDWIWPIMDGLKLVHRNGFLHRDIKPQNIMMRDDGRPVLLDFGAARIAIGDKTRTLTAIMTPGFAPLEQYETRGNQGPWTDIYALGAVIYSCIAGRKPKDVLDRMRIATLDSPESESSKTYSSSLIKGVMSALAMEGSDRPQSIEALLDILDAPDSQVTVRMPVRNPEPLIKAAAGLQPEELPSNRKVVNDEVMAAAVQHVEAEETSTRKKTEIQKDPWNFEVWFWSRVEALVDKKRLALMFNFLGARITAMGTYFKRWFVKKDSNKNKQKAPAKNKPKIELGDILLIVGKGLIIIAGIASFYIFGQFIMASQEAKINSSEKNLTPSEIAARKQMSSVNKAFSLLVNVKPEDARIKILNFSEPYERGMLLSPDSYQIEVSRPGYVTEKHWVKVINRDVQINFSLKEE